MGYPSQDPEMDYAWAYTAAISIAAVLALFGIFAILMLALLIIGFLVNAP